MMQTVEILEAFSQFSLRKSGNLHVLRVLRILVQQPHDTAPETVGPPVQSVVKAPLPAFVRPVVIISVFIRGIGYPLPVFLAHPCHLDPCFLQLGFGPFFITLHICASSFSYTISSLNLPVHHCIILAQCVLAVHTGTALVCAPLQSMPDVCHWHTAPSAGILILPVKIPRSYTQCPLKISPRCPLPTRHFSSA